MTYLLNSNTKALPPGLYLADKPVGPSSHAIVNYFRKQSGLKRVGHCGTLDPLASGLLIMLVGRDFTKLQDKYLKQDKEYLVTARLGVATDSYDVTGQITARSDWASVAKITKSEVLEQLKHFRGTIEQTVPIFSAVKIAGQKLYQKARRGETVTLPSRQVTLYELELVDFKKDVKKEELSCSLRVKCSSGTYIRSLVHDLGQKLGVGAHVSKLRRTQIGNFHVKNAMTITLADLQFKRDLDNQT
jgi:tRNA pseudouridine55 synthase